MATYGLGAHPDFYNPTTQAPTPTKTAPKPTSTSTSTPMTSGQKNAYQVMVGILAQYGLQSLAKTVLGYVKQGYTDSNAITVLLQQTPEWHQRFAGNDIRMKNGLAPLSAGEYLATEASYAQALKSNGLPAGFYDSHADFAQWIGGNVSVNEIQQRAQDAGQLAASQDPGVLQALAAEGITKDHLTAYFLDQKRALPILQNTYNAIGIGTAAADNGLSVDKSQIEKFASMGVTQGQAQNAYQQIAQTLPGEKTLGDIYGEAYGQSDLENELLGQSGQETLKRQRLNQREQAQFAGHGAVGSTLYNPGYGIGNPTAGQF